MEYFYIKVGENLVKIEEGKKYNIETRDFSVKGFITDLNFEYCGRTFFYILDDNEDYQIVDDEVLSVCPIK
jgi:hypothetical protein